MYEAGPWIAETLASVAAQTHPIHECIVVDDGSTDDGPDVVAAFAEESGFMVHLVSQANAGVSAARNAGLVRATGDLVALLDADDLWHPEKIERQVSLMSATGAAVCITGYALFDSGPLRATGVISFRRPKKALRRWLAMEGSGLCLASSGLIHRSALDRVRLFDDRVSICEDLEFTLRICREGLLASEPHVLVGYRNHAGQAHRRVNELAANTAVLLVDVLSEEEFGRSYLRRCRAGLEAHVGYANLLEGNVRLAVAHLTQAARRDPLRLLTIPVNAICRKAWRTLRARRLRGRWPLASMECD